MSKKPTEPEVEPTSLFEPKSESSALEVSKPPLQPQRSMLSMVMEAANNPTLDPARLKEFLQIGRELEMDQKKAEWSAAFRAAKNELDGYKITKRGQIVYEGKGGKQGGVVKFIRYDDIAAAVKPILQKHDLFASYTYRYEQAPPKAICVLALTHANGYSQNFESIPLPMVDSSGGKNDVQGAGSVMSYGRRYAICGAFDIVAEGEDTGGALVVTKPINKDQVHEIEQMVQDCESREPDFRRRFMRWVTKEIRVESLDDIFQGEQHKNVLAKLGEKQKELGL